MGIEGKNERQPIDLKKQAGEIADKVLFHVNKIIEEQRASSEERIGKDGIPPVKKQIEPKPGHIDNLGFKFVKFSENKGLETKIYSYEYSGYPIEHILYEDKDEGWKSTAIMEERGSNRKKFETQREIRDSIDKKLGEKQKDRGIKITITDKTTPKKPIEKMGDKIKQEEEKLIAKVAEILKMEKLDLLKEKPEWLENFVKFINKTNNLSYVEEIEKKEKGGFNEEYFKEKWPNSMYAIADNIPFETKIDLFMSGGIKDPAHIFTTEELKGELGKTKIKEKTIAELCAEQKDRANKTFTGIINANNDAIERNRNFLNTPVEKTILHDYLSLGKFHNGRDKVNIIYNDLGYLATRAYGFDTFILFNKEKGYFSIRSRFPLKEIGKKFGVRKEEGDVFIISGPILNMTEKEFLDTIDKKILARAKELPEKKE